MTLPSAQDLLAKLVAIPSPSGSETAVADTLAELLEGRGVRVERRGNTLSARTGALGRPSLLLCSHMDTVPAGSGWTRDPFAAKWEDRVLYGRGANDAKASVVAMVLAFLECARTRLEGELRLALTEQEETNNSGMAALLEMTGRPDGAVIGEPTGLEVVRAQKGLAVLTAKWRGRSCHAAHVEQVEHQNALTAAVVELATVPPKLALPNPHPLLGSTTMVPTQFKSGERHNVVPDAAEAVFDARIAPPHEAAEFAAFLRGMLPSAEVTIRSERLRAVETPEHHPLVRAALAAAGRTAAVGSRTLSDMALLSGVPAVKCGPGETARSHTPDEFVRLEEVEAGVSFYRKMAASGLRALVERGASQSA